MAQAPSTARIRQRRRQRLLLILVLLLLVVGAGAYMFLKPEKPKAQPRPEGSVAIPVARGPIPMGTTITQRMLRVDYMKPENVPHDAVIVPAQFERRIAMRDIRPGEYLRQDALSEKDAPNGFSGLAKPGMRVVVVETNNIKGTSGYLAAGDHVDVLAVGWVSGASGAAGAKLNPNSIAGGGIQPGDPNAAGRKGGGGGAAMEATLVAEDAVVLLAPPKNSRPGRRNTYTVLQMNPSDAHTTTLALGGGAQLRFVFRPFTEDKRIAEAKPLEQTTYVPRDERSVEVISGTSRKVQNAWSDNGVITPAQ